MTLHSSRNSVPCTPACGRGCAPERLPPNGNSPMRESTPLDAPPAGRAAAPAPEIPQAIRFRGTGFAPAPRGLTSWLVFAVVVAAWQAAGSLGLVSGLFLPSP